MRMGGLRAGVTWRLALLAGAAVITGPTLGATISWNGGTGDWFVAANWLPVEVPDGNDTAIVNNGGTMQAAAGSPITAQPFRFGVANGAGANAAGIGNLRVAGDALVGVTLEHGTTRAEGTLTVVDPRRSRSTV
jgi:hypothetical protein